MPDDAYEIQRDTIREGYDRKTCWVQARAGTVRTASPSVVLTMQKLLLTGSDIFYPLHEMRTDDLGRTWAGPVSHEESLGSRAEPGGVRAQVCDFTPKWHAPSGKLLGTGHVARYVGNRLMPAPRPRQVTYAVYDDAARRWTPWAILPPPDASRFFSCGAGSAQRVDLDDGTLLLPVYVNTTPNESRAHMASTVFRCAFDGRTLVYIEHGDELAVPEPRGLCEPSLARWGGRVFLTLRNDLKGYVTSGSDGLHFAEPKPWTFDDGTELGNYNTQQHWVTHGDALYLVYTRRGLNNDHVFRHRAPLVMARVDPDRLCLVRDTERELIPNRGARLGNFSVTAVSENETWVVAAEWMQNDTTSAADLWAPCEQYGSNNAVFAARLRWETPNQQVADQ